MHEADGGIEAGEPFLRHALMTGRQILVLQRRGKEVGQRFLPSICASGRFGETFLVDDGPDMETIPALPLHRPAIPGGAGWPSATRMTDEYESCLRSGPAGGYVDPRLDMDIEAFLTRREILIARTAGKPMTHWFGALSRTAMEMAERIGGSPPVVLNDMWRTGRPKAPRPGWVHFAFETFSGFLPGDDPSLGASRSGIDEAWEAMLERRRRQVTVEERDGVVTASGFGVRAHLVHAGCGMSHDPGIPNADTILLCAIGRDGIVRGFAQSSTDRIGDAEAKSLAVDACVGYPRAPGKAKAFQYVMQRLGECVVQAPEHREFLSRIREDVGPERMRALSKVAGRDTTPYEQAWASTPRRRQFLATYPSLMPAARDPQVTRMVDAGLPVASRLAELMGTTPAIARRFAAQKRCSVDMGDPASWPRVGRFLGEIGHGALPRDGDRSAWWRLLQAYRTLSGIGEGRGAEPLVGMLVRTLPGSTWEERDATVQRYRRVSEWSCKDFLEGISTWLEALSAPPGIGWRRSTSALVREYGTLARILDATEAWHAHPVLLASAGIVPRDATWPVPFGRIELPGATATALDSMAALIAEGATGPDADGADGLGHCVASYGEACARGGSLIVSIRAKVTGRRLSTLELCPDPDGDWRIGGNPYRARQHHGRRNANPPPDAVEAASGLRDLLLSGHPVDAESLLPRDISTGCGSMEDAERLLPLWRPLLPPGWRRLDADGIRARIAEIAA